MANDPNARLYREAPLHDTHPYQHLSKENLQWLIETGENPDYLISFIRLLREHPRKFRLLVTACSDPIRRPILAALLHSGGAAHYQELREYTPCSLRTIKRHAYALEEDGLVCIDDGKPATVSFPSEALEILAESALSLFFSEV